MAVGAVRMGSCIPRVVEATAVPYSRVTDIYPPFPTFSKPPKPLEQGPALPSVTHPL